mmetsp:Transcript_11559/g.28829  ORF Transcript_11559/g.28829 Transcript_11559/m.28829 type:complete len:226 (-) Transcript_11559:1041-1718(-)
MAKKFLPMTSLKCCYLDRIAPRMQRLTSSSLRKSSRASSSLRALQGARTLSCGRTSGRQTRARRRSFFCFILNRDSSTGWTQVLPSRKQSSSYLTIRQARQNPTPSLRRLRMDGTKDLSRSWWASRCSSLWARRTSTTWLWFTPHGVDTAKHLCRSTTRQRLISRPSTGMRWCSLKWTALSMRSKATTCRGSLRFLCIPKVSGRKALPMYHNPQRTSRTLPRRFA